jgi:uncharacterized protein (TIGR00730 family)
MKRICVFCGSSNGVSEYYGAAASALGRELARRGIGLVYGGASIGLMGKVANAALAAGGEVTGVIPKALVREEVVHTGLTDLRIVDSMHARKAEMEQLSDGFMALPGGIGTLEEFVEMLTWLQLRFHAKPCGLLNVNGYYEHFVRFLDYTVEEGFLKAKHRAKLVIADTPVQIVDAFSKFAALPESKRRGLGT